MSERVFEWFRIVSATPSEELLANRGKSAQTAIAALQSDKTHSMVAELVALVAFGPLAATALTGSLITTIKEHQNAFPTDIDECGLEIRVFSGLIIESLLASTEAAHQKKRLLAASLLDAGLSFRERTTQEYLEKELQRLLETARTLVAEVGAKVRLRAPLQAPVLAAALKADEAITTAQVDKLRVATLGAFNHLVTQSRIDQEELNILWWLFSGHSGVAKRKMSDLEEGAAAYCCGYEIAELAMAPCSASLFEIVDRAVEQGRKPASLKSAGLSELVQSWKSPVDLSLLTKDGKGTIPSDQFPMLFPLGWLSRKIQSTNSTQNWEKDFTDRTGVSATKTVTPMELARQIVKERHAQRLL